jgi:hypothetical protein
MAGIWCLAATLFVGHEAKPAPSEYTEWATKRVAGVISWAVVNKKEPSVALG